MHMPTMNLFYTKRSRVSQKISMKNKEMRKKNLLQAQYVCLIVTHYYFHFYSTAINQRIVGVCDDTLTAHL